MFGTRNFTARAVSFLNMRFVCITNEAEQYDLLHTAEIMSSTLKSDCQLLIAEEAAPSIWHEHSEMWTVCWIAVNKPSLFRTSCCHSFYLHHMQTREFPLALSNGNYLSSLELKEVREMEQKQMVEREWVMGRRNRKWGGEIERERHSTSVNPKKLS